MVDGEKKDVALLEEIKRSGVVFGDGVQAASLFSSSRISSSNVSFQPPSIDETKRIRSPNLRNIVFFFFFM